MSDFAADLAALLRQAEDLPAGPAQVDLLASAAAVADSRNDVAGGFRVRKKLLEAALDGGQPEQMTVAFAWCLAQSDRNPEVVPPDEVLWEYRWVVSELPHFPQVPRQQIEDAIADMARRYRAAGSTLRPVHLLRLNVAIGMGDAEAADAAYRDWSAVERDHLSDNVRTEQGFVVDYHVFRKRYEEAVALSPKVMTGRVDDVHFFGQDSAELLIPLLELGRVADAVRVQRSGYRYVANRHRYLNSIGSHVEFHGRLDNWAAGAKVFEDHVGFALGSKQYSDRFYFLLGSYVLFRRWERTGETAVKLRVPKEMPVRPRPDRTVSLAALNAWLKAELDDWAARYDARNGNGYFGSEVRRAESAAELPTARV